MYSKPRKKLDEPDQGPDNVLPTSKTITWSLDEPVRLRMENSSAVPLNPISVVSAFKNVAKEYPNNVALVDLYERVEEIYSYKKYYKSVVQMSKAFIKIGLNSNRAVGIIGHNSPFYFISHLASIFAGGISAGIPASCSDEAVCYLAEKAQCEIIVVENDQHLRRIVRLSRQLTFVRAIVLCRGKPLSSASNVYSWSDLMQMNADDCKEESKARIKNIAPNKCCALVAKTDANGNPKWIMLSHDNILWSVSVFQSYMNEGKATAPITALCYRSLSKLSVLYVDLYWPILSNGGTAYVARPDTERSEALVKAIKTVRPTVLFAASRVWEDLMDSVFKYENNSNYVKKQFSEWARKVGYSKYVADKNGENEPVMFNLAKHAALEELVREIGLDRCSIAITSTCKKSVLKFFQSLNITLQEIYGTAECGPISATLKSNFKPGASGRTLPGVEVKLHQVLEDTEEEILCKGRNVFMGYLNEEEATMKAFDKDIWYRTGDIGRLDKEGFLYVTGRLIDIIVLSNGTNIVPAPIEKTLLKKLSCLSHCVLIGENRQYLSVLLVFKTRTNPCFGETSNVLHPKAVEWCRSVGTDYLKLSHLINSNDHCVATGIQSAIDAVNEETHSEKEWIRKWVILPRDFTIAGGELGPSLKVNRIAVNEIYTEEIEFLYE